MPKWWSRPVNRVDRAAYHHDLAYAKYKNRAKRIEADKKMIRALDAIDTVSYTHLTLPTKRIV